MAFSAKPKTLAALAGAALATAATLAAAPVSGATAAPPAAGAGSSAYLPEHRDAARDAVFQQRIDAALAKAATAKASGARAAAVQVTYDDSQAPSFDSLIDRGAQIWNSSVSAVQLVEVDGGADLEYYEGDDPSGSYYYGSGRGDGYVFMDYAQSEQFDTLRIITHETGHALGLPDRYTQPCSKLMSGGGPGPSCTNAYPDAAESDEVDALWGGGFAALTPAP